MSATHCPQSVDPSPHSFNAPEIACQLSFPAPADVELRKVLIHCSTLLFETVIFEMHPTMIIVFTRNSLIKTTIDTSLLKTTINNNLAKTIIKPNESKPWKNTVNMDLGQPGA